ncbi:low molecular weight phosphotyrosine protein phosphatase [Georgenia sp. TF02-10]|uniref:low molecular weight protein-tyrosine-phosphatase n=1 Tax=Georgenia sp. TF02-10 TaxID=2917725 RepID=UPI001FA6AD4B|nr:low molecular weight protein-tyrosine-phosphatase [Georgenia sp. TF02-10]UNX55033.1 low molecular weight phosphotyrosine protein phosphatase [Georgenia sp. TF02-10]
MPDVDGARRPFRLLVVCTGNICRSPMGEVVLRERLADAGLADDVEVASAGTSDEEHGRPIDPRARAVLAEHGYPVPRHRAHQVVPGELGRYDLALAMTSQHARALRRRADEDGGGAEIRLWREFDDTAPRLGDGATERDLDVPDPWYGDQDGFYDTLAVVERGADGLVRYLQERLGPG